MMECTYVVTNKAKRGPYLLGLTKQHFTCKHILEYMLESPGIYRNRITQKVKTSSFCGKDMHRV